MVDVPATKPAEESMQDPPPDVLDAKDEAALLRRVSELLADGTPAIPTGKGAGRQPTSVVDTRFAVLLREPS